MLGFPTFRLMDVPHNDSFLLSSLCTQCVASVFLMSSMCGPVALWCHGQRSPSLLHSHQGCVLEFCGHAPQMSPAFGWHGIYESMWDTQPRCLVQLLLRGVSPPFLDVLLPLFP